MATGPFVVPPEILRIMEESKKEVEEKLFSKGPVSKSDFMIGTGTDSTTRPYYAPPVPLSIGTTSALTPTTTRVGVPVVSEMQMNQLATLVRIAEALEKIVERFC